ncbi:hypothetical protein HS1genome_1745 [Sulfodiicoccus acidiphilus]|uniref:Uncharacterized protein n=1 Tax=Sulfodiicoccus acidiphilus TaxID=1670455 RepID=A0A348B5A4_9CREN|nr:hypothetical protein [Sulfodiicoccus acidiphilus]BBD73356.1 hypothetical protein HS1genome_1745 [Sulfodiicoccus acidiphilus]GGT88872.1 hypothetical protein GCM10007116_03360 [Sulfodiicoccus acidiphilus]
MSVSKFKVFSTHGIERLLSFTECSLMIQVRKKQFSVPDERITSDCQLRTTLIKQYPGYFTNI